MEMDVIGVNLSTRRFDLSKPKCFSNYISKVVTKFPERLCYFKFKECVCYIISDGPGYVTSEITSAQSSDLAIRLSTGTFNIDKEIIIYRDSSNSLRVILEDNDSFDIFNHASSVVNSDKRRIPYINDSDLGKANKNVGNGFRPSNSSFVSLRQSHKAEIPRKTKGIISNVSEQLVKPRASPASSNFFLPKLECSGITIPVQTEDNSRVLLSSGYSFSQSKTPRAQSSVCIEGNPSRNQVRQQSFTDNSVESTSNIENVSPERNRLDVTDDLRCSSFQNKSTLLANTRTPDRHSFVQTLVNKGRSRLRAPKYPNYSDITSRMRTFARWPRSLPTPTQLSDAGFYYTNELDLVRCFQCGLGLKDFSNNDDPLLEHVKNSENCVFLLEKYRPQQLDEIKRRQRERNPNEFRRQQFKDVFDSTRGEDNALQLIRHPELQSYESRLATFERWPSHLMQKPEQLAEAGLYYIGINDNVRCFCCDGGLKSWDPEDIPWLEHCKWFPACPYAREQKGDEYIALVQELADSELNASRLSTETAAFQADLESYRYACVQEMGFENTVFDKAIEELRMEGNLRPQIEDVIAAIQIVNERLLMKEQLRDQEKRSNETPETIEEENKRLKGKVECIKCKGSVNALFLPCTHHKMCMECAKSVFCCPVCGRIIREKIKTFMV